MTIQHTIPLSQLVHSAANVRLTEPLRSAAPRAAEV